MPIEPNRPPWLTRSDWITIIIGIAGIAIGIALTNESRENFGAALRRYGLSAGIGIAGLALVIGVVLALIRTRSLRTAEQAIKSTKDKNEELTEGIASLTAELANVKSERDHFLEENKSLQEEKGRRIEYGKVDRDRWESLVEKPVRFGHMAYMPFLHYDKAAKPAGLGKELLYELFNLDISGKHVTLEEDEKNDRNWTTIFDGLKQNKYDVVATPLFATFNRTKEVGFTAPLFFSNVGLYVSQSLSQDSIWKNVTMETLPVALSRTPALKFLTIRGEISMHLAEKFLSHGAVLQEFESGISPSALFTKVAESTNTPYALFCESFSAQQHAAVQANRVCNVLKWHQVLYPVCFATRLGDYQLTNFLNIRMLKLTRDKRIVDLLAKKLAEIEGNSLDESDIKKHFVAEWPCPIDL